MEGPRRSQLRRGVLSADMRVEFAALSYVD